jgi:SAM-dependent methyltransferase
MDPDLTVLHATVCAICRTEGNAVELYPANLGREVFNPVLFSARRLPDRVHYRIVKCRTCGLVRSDPVAEAGNLASLYRQSTFDYGDEIANLKRTYGRYLAALAGLGARKGSLLEIGCGNGFFMEMALEQGYQTVSGVEPSRDAVGRAQPWIRPAICCDLMRPGLFTPGSFDVICMFQVLDHLPDPSAVLNECFRLLTKQGMILAINHDVASLSAIIFQEKSPIIDIEHTYLYSQVTMRHLFEQTGLTVRQQGRVINDYSVNYLARLLPLPKGLKSKLLGGLKGSRLGKATIRVSLGNLYLTAQKTL